MHTIPKNGEMRWDAALVQTTGAGVDSETGCLPSKTAMYKKKIVLQECDRPINDLKAVWLGYVTPFEVPQGVGGKWCSRCPPNKTGIYQKNKGLQKCDRSIKDLGSVSPEYHAWRG